MNTHNPFNKQYDKFNRPEGEVHFLTQAGVDQVVVPLDGADEEVVLLVLKIAKTGRTTTSEEY